MVAELVRNAAPVQCFLTEPAYVLADGNCGLLVSLSGAQRGRLARGHRPAPGERDRPPAGQMIAASPRVSGAGTRVR